MFRNVKSCNITQQFMLIAVLSKPQEMVRTVSGINHSQTSGFLRGTTNGFYITAFFFSSAISDICYNYMLFRDKTFNVSISLTTGPGNLLNNVPQKVPGTLVMFNKMLIIFVSFIFTHPGYPLIPVNSQVSSFINNSPRI